MKLGCLTAMFSAKSLKETLDILRPFGLQAIEVGTGNYPGSAHVPVQELMASDAKCREYKKVLADEGLEISALSCHGNCLHPDKAFAQKNVEVQTTTIKLAEKLGVKVVIDFSGCPGAEESSTKPNWVTCPWPPDYLDILNWQWEKKVIPFWTKQA